MYELYIPDELTRHMISIAWNLGGISFTGGALRAAEEERIEVNLLLLKHLVGDYGDLSWHPQDHQRMVDARAEGKPFSSVFDLEEDYIKVVTIPEQRRTFVCLASED